jgi:hypothetical protein
MEIESGASFAESDFRHDGWLVPPGRINTQYLCAVPGKKSACYRTGENARQVQNTQSLERTSRAERPVSNCGWIQHGEVNQRFCRNCTTLRMLLPLSHRAHFRGAPARLHYGLLEIALRPLSH